MNSKINHKINFVYHNLEGDTEIESVWAAKEGDNYRIKNIPFFAPNIAYDDLVSAEYDDGQLFFDSLIEASGHSTVQIIFFKSEYFDQVTRDLINFKCGWEGYNSNSYISINVPQAVNYSEVRKYLDEKLTDSILDFKEACLAHSI